MSTNQHEPAELIYFLHIPKTSGTSLAEILLEVGGPGAVVPPVLWDHLITGAYVVSESTRIITGHLAGLFPLWLRRWPRIITMLREPRARALSHINHVQREPSHPWFAEGSKLSVEQYCNHPVFRRSVDNLQARHLASLQFSLALLPDSPDRSAVKPSETVGLAFNRALFSLDRMTGLYDAAVHALRSIECVGITEAHRHSLRLFARKLHWQIPLEERRKNIATSGQRSLDSLSATELELLTDLNTVDLAVYRFACGHFRELCQQSGIELDQAFLDWSEQFQENWSKAA